MKSFLFTLLVACQSSAAIIVVSPQTVAPGGQLSLTFPEIQPALGDAIGLCRYGTHCTSDSGFLIKWYGAHDVPPFRTLAPISTGTYVYRFFRGDGASIGESVPFIVAGESPYHMSVSPSNPEAGSSVTLTWNVPYGGAYWLDKFSVIEIDGAGTRIRYVSSTQMPGEPGVYAAATGTIAIPVPSQPGLYAVQYDAGIAFAYEWQNGVGRSNVFAVGATPVISSPIFSAPKPVATPKPVVIPAPTATPVPCLSATKRCSKNADCCSGKCTSRKCK